MLALKKGATYRYHCEKIMFGYKDKYFLTGRFIRDYIDDAGTTRMLIEESNSGCSIHLCASTVVAVS